MTIIVEDGSIVANANSYINAAYLTQYATDRGYTLPTSVEPLIHRAMDAFIAYEWAGGRTDPDSQALEWPRTGVCGVGDHEIPAALKQAQAALSVAAADGSSNTGGSGGVGPVVERTEGDLSIRYAEPVAEWSTSGMTTAFVDALLRPFTQSAGFSLRSVRV